MWYSEKDNDAVKQEGLANMRWKGRMEEAPEELMQLAEGWLSGCSSLCETIVHYKRSRLTGMEGEKRKDLEVMTLWIEDICKNSLALAIHCRGYE